MKSIIRIIGRLAYFFGKPFIGLVFRFGPVRTRVFVVVRGELLLIKNVVGQGRWSLPGGGLQKNESYQEGASRELHEELGIAIPSSQFALASAEPLSVTHGAGRFQCMPLILRLDRKPSLQLRLSEVSQARWCPIDTVKSLTLSTTTQDLFAALEHDKNLLK